MGVSLTWPWPLAVAVIISFNAMCKASVAAVASQRQENRDVADGEFNRLLASLLADKVRLSLDEKAVEILQRMGDEHNKMLGKLQNTSEELANARKLIRPETQNVTEDEVKPRAFLAPKASGDDVVVPSRKLWDPDQWGPDVNVYPPGIDMPDVPRPPWVTELPPAKAAQFGFNICRNGNFQHGGCCQQILHECCSAHAQNNREVEWEMCFDEEKNLLTVHTLGRRKFSILVAKISENPKEYHAKFEGPNAECYPNEDFVIYAFDR